MRAITRSAVPAGETYVWVTGMGLAVGITMIAALLLLIAVNGITVFWPRRVALIEFEPDGPTSFQGTLVATGPIMVEQEKDTRDLTVEQIASDDPDATRELQLFVGNRDAYGQSFAYFDVGDIASVSYPEGIIRAERLEWGDAIFRPLRLELAEAVVLPADDPAFRDTLRQLNREIVARWREINRIERFQIGRINERMRALELEERFFARLEEPTAEQRVSLERVEEQIAELQSQYEPLAERAGEMRRSQNEATLHYELVTGEERSIPMGDVVSYYYANDINVFERAAIFLTRGFRFLTEFPREANTEGGIFPAIFGTFVMTLLMSIAVMPFGVIAAIYLREYAKQGALVRGVRIAVNNLAGVPSIVFGTFGLGFFIHFVGGGIDQFFFARNLPDPTFKTGGILWASLTLALMTLPVVIVATEESLAAVSRGVREGSLACGASKWQTIRHLVLPASAPGIMTGLILAMARGAGEVAPLILVGVVALAPNLPIDRMFPFIHLERKFMHLGFHIYDVGFQSPDSEAAIPMVFATTLVLITIVVVLNLAAIVVRNNLRKKFSESAF